MPMPDPPNVSQILAALAAARPSGTPISGQPLQHQLPPHGYPPSYPSTAPPMGVAPYHIPQPSNSGSIDLTNVKPVSSGSVSLADAISRQGGSITPSRDTDPRLAGRIYGRSRSRSRSPRMIQNFRDSYNPYRDERRDDTRRHNGMSYERDRTFSPDRRGPLPGSSLTPPPGRGFGGPEGRSPMGRRGGDDYNTEMISVEAGVVGLVIGRQGETLRRIEADTSTRIQFPPHQDQSGPMRQCKITGPRLAREDAKNEVHRIIQENGNATSNSGSGRAPPPPGRDMGIGTGGGTRQSAPSQTPLRAGEDATQIMVPNRTVGLIIGRGGETIRDLQERSQCHVNITPEDKSVNGLRPVNLLGSPSAAAMAKELIMEIVESDTKNLANQGGMPRDNPGAPLFRGGDGEKINDRIVVPSEAVGMIIGKGGETIKSMQADTGCKINVATATGQDFERDIGLVGSRDSIEWAKDAIMEKVRAVQEKNNRPGGVGGGRQPDRQFNGPSYPNNEPPTQRLYGQQSAPTQQSAQVQPPAGDKDDPYAAYGGYENYAMLWYRYQAQNQQNSGPQGPS